MSSDPLAFLFSLERLGMKFGLENISRLAEALGHPERAFTSILVGGTNGKGSVTAMVESALRAGGLSVARYTSPHLVRLEERFVVDGAEVATATLRETAAHVEAVVERMVRERSLDGLPTFFECTTAIAFELFRRARVEVAVLEVGLGGRLDATNIVTPVACAITSIDLDHQVQLGDSIESIAREKAGIVKPGVPLVCGPLPDVAERVVAAICEERGAPIVRADRRTLDALGPVRLALRGAHQRDNAGVAIALLRQAARRGVRVSDDAIRAGLERAEWPARLELFTSGGVEVLVDAAHNPSGARALAAWLVEAGWSGIALVFGAMRDKDVAGMLAAILPLCARVICTTPPNPRAIPAADLATMVRRLDDRVEVEVVPDPAAALSLARARGPRVVAAGSIFLIGPLRDILR